MSLPFFNSLKIKFLKHAGIYLSIFILIITVIFLALSFYNQTQLDNYKLKAATLETQQLDLTGKLALTTNQLNGIKNEDQVKKNLALNDEINSINSTYNQSVVTYQQLIDLKDQTNKKFPALDKSYAQIVNLLSQRKYSEAKTSLTTLNTQIGTEVQKAAPTPLPQAASTSGANAPTSNTPPGSGYSRQNVTSDVGVFLVDIIAADLNSTKVIVDTASDGDCGNGCPVLPLADYASRNGAFAGINGSYFCPESYPQCAGKTNSFDTLLMNKNKRYFNSDNNVYSTVPAVIFSGNSARFVSQSLEWGRDTGVDSVIANYPMMVQNDQVVFGGGSDPKQGSKGPRSFVGNKGSTAYIGVVQNATVAEAAHVLKAAGLTNALNLDSGGSTALWSGGYKAGPGRSIPNALLFVKK